VSWATQCHFLLGRIERDQMTVRAIGELETPAAAPIDLIRIDAHGAEVTGPIEVRRVR
jgi:hypothetical protein